MVPYNNLKCCVSNLGYQLLIEGGALCITLHALHKLISIGHFEALLGSLLHNGVFSICASPFDKYHH